MRFMNFRNNSGHTLVESIVAIGILTAGLLGVVTLAIQSVRVTDISESKLQAEHLAAEGIELVRAMRDEGFRGGGSSFRNPGLGDAEVGYGDIASTLGVGTAASFNLDVDGEICPESGSEILGVLESCPFSNASRLSFEPGPDDQFGTAANLLVMDCGGGAACLDSRFDRTVTLTRLEDDSGNEFVRVRSEVAYQVRGIRPGVLQPFVLETDLYAWN